MTNCFFGVLVFALFAASVFIFHSISQKKTARMAFYGGAIIFFGSWAMSFITAFHFENSLPAQLEYVKNGFLIWASIGANFIASSFLLPSGNQQSNP